MTERSEQLQVTASVFKTNCKRQPDCPQQACPLQDVLNDLLQISPGSLTIEKAVESSRVKGLVQAMNTKSVVLNGGSPQDTDGQTIVMDCLQGNARDGNLKSCGTLSFVQVNN